MKGILVLSAIPIVFFIIYYAVQQFRPGVRQPNQLNPQYDYIIVGGGAAGCVLASRLSEDPKISVLLLEAGGEENELFYSHLPGMAPLLQNTGLDWSYLTVSQDDCCSGLKDKKVKWPRGKVLGGSSVLNYVHYVRGHESDFDWWDPDLFSASLHDSAFSSVPHSRWAYKDVEPYFHLLENVEVDRLRIAKGRQGKDGPISLSENLKLKTEAGQIFSEALTAAKLRLIDDISIPQAGFGVPLFMVKSGRRVSSVSAYLRPAMHRPNLHVVTGALVNRVTFNFDDVDKKAAGVEYEHDGASHRVLTNREVIFFSTNSCNIRHFCVQYIEISAGSIEGVPQGGSGSHSAINSSQILQLSGIGPKDQLEKLGIQPIVNLPSVGKNLKDHVGIVVRYSVNRSVGLDASDILSLSGLTKSVIDYVFHGSGILAYPPIEFMGFLESEVVSGMNNDEQHSRSSSDLQFYFSPTDLMAADFTNMINFANAFDQGTDYVMPSRNIISLGVVLVKPQSHGHIDLQRSKLSVQPLIDPKYFNDERDFVRLLSGLKFLNRALLQNEKFKALDIKLESKNLVGCGGNDNLDIDDENFLDCLVRNQPLTAYHPMGTCKMGSNPNDSVLDSELKVHGVNGLRVVDASIIPEDVSANICATVIMIAEKAADIIKNGWR